MIKFTTAFLNKSSPIQVRIFYKSHNPLKDHNNTATNKLSANFSNLYHTSSEKFEKLNTDDGQIERFEYPFTNSEIKKEISKAINDLRSKSSNIKEVFKALKQVHTGEATILESYEFLEKKEIIPSYNFKLREAFYTIGSELCIPRNGATNLLREAYQNDKPSISFLEYQQQNTSSIYSQLKKEMVDTSLIGSETEDNSLIIE